MNSQSIGIFDSGIGGLTVLKALKAALPYENFIYLGDTARLPYGTKSPETVADYALNANAFLVEQGIKALVIACNTATAHGLPALINHFAPLPIIGVIEPGIAAACALPNTGPIVVMATESTVEGHAYRDVLAAFAPERTIIEWPCSLWVALAEAGWCSGDLVEQIIAKSLAPLLEKLTQKPSCFLLGCTHFPVLEQSIQRVVGDVLVINPAERVAKETKWLLSHLGALNTGHQPGQVRFFATDGPARFSRLASVFLDENLVPEQIEWVHLAHPFSKGQIKAG